MEHTGIYLFLKIVDLIKKKTRQNKEEFQGSELEALELTLKKFVDIQELIKDLTEFNNSIVDYYRTSEVSFSKGVLPSTEFGYPNSLVRDICP